jgi:hypothetical protein
MAEAMLTRADIEAALGELGEIAHKAGKVIDVAVYGGAALMLTFPSRPATRDVDAVARGDAAFLREAVDLVAQLHGWSDRWLNDAVKGFLSERDPQSVALFKSYPSEVSPGLRVYLAQPEYLLAMKCMAMRVTQAESSPDREDIKMLARHLHLTSIDQVLDIVARYYPRNLIPPKTYFGVEEIIGELQQETGDGR